MQNVNVSLFLSANWPLQILHQIFLKYCKYLERLANPFKTIQKKSLGHGSLANTPIVPLEQLNAFVNSYMTRCFKYFRINPPISLTNDTGKGLHVFYISY